MAKTSKKSKSGKAQQRQRRERRFEPRATTNPWVVYSAGVLGAMAMGAGTWGQFGRMLGSSAAEPFKYAPWILAAGAVLVGVAIWFGTSGEPVLCVGDGGVGIERGTTRRIPWHQVESITYAAGALKVMGRDDTEQALTVTASINAQAQAAAWILAEARSRIPTVVDVPDDAPIPAAQPAPELIMESLRVVGRHCAHSGKVISYEPDARICPRCERIYHQELMPDRCLCGASLASVAGRKTETAEGSADAERAAPATALASEELEG